MRREDEERRLSLSLCRHLHTEQTEGGSSPSTHNQRFHIMYRACRFNIHVLEALPMEKKGFTEHDFSSNWHTKLLRRGLRGTVGTEGESLKMRKRRQRGRGRGKGKTEKGKILRGFS